MRGPRHRPRSPFPTRALVVLLLAWAPHAMALETHSVDIADLDFDNDDCMDCHDGEDTDFDPDAFEGSVHSKLFCVDCHANATPDHDDSDEELSAPDCSSCHAAESHAFSGGIHGRLVAKKDPDAPDCSFCHGTHGILAHTDPHSRTFPLNVPALCSECHRDGERSAVRDVASKKHIAETYSMSVHGQGLLRDGLVVSATCTSCHTAHAELPAKDPRSSVHGANLIATCGKCHYGIEEKLAESVHAAGAKPVEGSHAAGATPAEGSHAAGATPAEGRLPDCRDCHNAHAIRRPDQSQFRFEIISQCGHCHEAMVETYFDTYHGQASRLGARETARCPDCHGSHEMFPSSDPRSTLHASNIVATCGKCHRGSNANFVQYRPHADPHDRKSFPQLFYAYWFMTVLLVGTIGFFGLHSVLWLIRSLIARAQEGGTRPDEDTLAPEGYIRRFEPIDIVLHAMVVTSFLALVLTGMALRYPETGFFAGLARLLGGPRVTSVIHRIGAVVTFAYLGIHLVSVASKLRRGEISLSGLVREDYSILPQWRDVREFVAHVRWFLGLGARPDFGRWTYWEKFDYFAVLWGVVVIGLTGLVLWFPEVVTLVLPGWVINVSMAIHSDEALLAAAFIFTIHFFNTQFRPDRFPFDPVIFTGRMPLHAFREDHRREYDRLVESGRLEARLVGPPPRWLSVFGWVFGFTALAIGIGSIVAIVYSIFFV
jgi:cytochrome b subunit of formate dehydrogenase